ncbi:uncharacterized protein LOC114365243 [Ostrinia furnacalis]|uniref:uncharacterized protein LOC114365243 n=1 Tax=Ostrinia furnacalis TaxID=93504 RepID=UPI00103C1D89|nr:uncharacterized protein LOC114365243 [Ostrinia furnacalis]
MSTYHGGMEKQDGPRRDDAGITEIQDGRATPPSRSRSRTRRPRKRPRRSRSGARRSRPSRRPSSSSGRTGSRGRSSRRRDGSDVSRRRRRRADSRRTAATRTRPSRSRSRSKSSGERRARRRHRHRRSGVRRSSSHRVKSQAPHHKRRRRETVSESSCTDSLDSYRGSSKKNASKTVDKYNFSIQDVMELIKSLPSSASQSQNHFSMSTNALPEFDPANKEQTVDIWINKVEECASLYNWSETQLLHYALPKFTGLAKVWYNGLRTLKYNWAEWKAQLIAQFPTVENYAQILHDMLNRKVKPNEPLETYYYHKINLLNRCDINGKRAVDCLLDGLEDKGLRLGAQAANYSHPEELLSFFKSVKTEDAKEKSYRQPFTKRRFDGANDSSKPILRCFNCNEVGHPSFKCTKPLVSCNICKRLGHQSANCKRLYKNSQGVDKSVEKDKAVSEIKLAGGLDEKYILPIFVNDKPMTCYVDLGSQSTLIRLSNFSDLNVIYSTNDLPSLKGFGQAIIEPIGRAVVQIQVQSVKISVEVLVVPDELLKHPVLLGHTFTEQAGVVIIKTDEHLVFQKKPDIDIANQKCKNKLVISCDVVVNSINMVPIRTDTNSTINVYVRESVRNVGINSYFVMPGLYTITQGEGHIMVVNLNSHEINFKNGQLLTRAHLIDETNCLNIRMLECEKGDHIEDCLKTGSELHVEDRIKLKALLEEYRSCFSFGLTDLGLTNLTEMTITLKDTTPVVYRPYRLAYSERNKVKEMIQEMLDSGIITESESAYASPILLVQKKTGDQRLCVDYRALNAKTIKEHYPLPRIEDQIDQLGGYQYFITLDLASGYYQIPLDPSSQDKTAFVTPDGQYQFTRMPFGLANAPSVFQKTINKMLKDVKNEAFAFMDDIIIPANSISQGMERLKTVLELIKKAGLTLKLSKCLFFCQEIDYLGFEVSKNGVRPGSRKTEAVENFKCPTNQHEVRQFLGLASFFRRFVKNFAIIANPLTRLLKKDSRWEWGTEQAKAFSTLKSELVKRPILALYDVTANTQIHTDACKTGIAGMLLQEDNTGRWRAVAYYSRQTTQEEQKYHSFELETLAVIASLQRFRVYVLGIKFVIVTDCNALRTTLSKRDIIPRISRWWLQLQEYDCGIEYRPGNRMCHVDALSRNAIPQSCEPEPVFDILAVETEDWLTTIQGADEEVQRVKQILEDPETPKINEVYQNYRIKGGKVYRVVDSQLKWLVPRGFRWQLLKKCHDELGHFGVDKTLDKLKSLYWFPKMTKFVKKYVQSCLECSYHKIPAGKRQGMLHPIPKIDKPFHTVHMDHLGPFVRSKSRNSYLLVLVEAYTKYVNLYAVKNTKSKSTIKVLNQYFSLFGIPSRLISDRGTSFTSKSFKDFVNSLGIKHVLNAVATPRANGQVERYNRTILASLAVKNHNCKENEWDVHLEEIQLGLNTTINKGTGKSPAEVLFGTKLRAKSDGIVTSLLEQGEVGNSQENLQTIRENVNARIDEEQAKQKERFDKTRRVGRKYKTGDLVRIEREVGSNDGKSRKLMAKLQGPYRIVKVLNNDRFAVEDTPLTRKQNRKYEAVVALDKIHPWLSFTREGLADTDEESLTDSGDSRTDLGCAGNDEGETNVVSQNIDDNIESADECSDNEVND